MDRGKSRFLTFLPPLIQAFSAWLTLVTPVQTVSEAGVAAHVGVKRLVVAGDGIAAAYQGVRSIKAVLCKDDMGGQVLCGRVAL